MTQAHTLRNIAVSALLGLPAALVAHAMVFGRTHAVGGALHGAALHGAAGFALIAAVISGFGAARGKRGASPTAGMLLGTSAAWLATFEVTESAHAVPVLLCIGAIIVAGALFALATRAYEDTVRAIAQALFTRAATAHAASPLHRSANTYFARRTSIVFALFSRPPPALS